MHRLQFRETLSHRLKLEWQDLFATPDAPSKLDIKKRDKHSARPAFGMARIIAEGGLRINAEHIAHSYCD